MAARAQGIQLAFFHVIAPENESLMNARGHNIKIITLERLEGNA